MKTKILSVDGGGVRGIIPATILAYLENKMIEETGDPTTRISDHLDLFAGTSTGSIISASAVIPNNKDGRPYYKMDEIVTAYYTLAKEVFKKDFWRNVRTLWGLIGPKFSNKGIETNLYKHFGLAQMRSLIKPLVITSYDTDKRKAIIYTSDDEKKKYNDYYIKDIVRGSTSIPAFFPPAYFKSGDDINTDIDGGVFANNPTMVAFVEASKSNSVIKDNNFINPRNTLTLSFSCGSSDLKKYDYQKIKRWGMAWWFIPILNILVQGVGSVTHYEMTKFYEYYNASDNYIRIDPLIKIGSSNSQDASPQNMKNLHQDALNYIEENKEFLDNLVKRLIQ